VVLDGQFDDRIEYEYKVGGTWFTDTLLPTYNSNRWYHIRIDFDCTNTSYMNLPEDKCNVYIDGQLVGINKSHSSSIIPNPTGIGIIEFSVGYNNSGLNWIDAVDYSWAPGYYKGRNLHYINENEFIYLGAYSFTDDIVGTHPINWTITEDGISNIQVIESYNSHSKVVQIQASNAANPTVEAWMANDHSEPLFLILRTINGSEVFRVVLDGQFDDRIEYEFKAGGTWFTDVLLPNYTSNKWYHVRIDFDCTNSSYKNLLEDRCNIYINGQLVGLNKPHSSSMVADPTGIAIIEFSVGYNNSGFNWIDAVDYSWASGYYEGRNLQCSNDGITYFGAYSFTDDFVYSHPVNWSVSEDGISDIQVIQSFNIHSKVVQIQASNAANPGVGKMILNLSEQGFGTVEAWMANDHSEPLFLILRTIDGSEVFRVVFDGQFDDRIEYEFKAGGTWFTDVLLPNYTSNKWYHVRIDFDCTNGKYKNLLEDRCNIYIDDQLVGANKSHSSSMVLDPTGIAIIEFSVGYNNSGLNWIDAVDYSWAPGYYEGRNKYNTTPDLSILSPINLHANPDKWTNINYFNISWENPPDSSGIAGFFYKLDSPPTSNYDGTYINSPNITNYSGITLPSDGNHSIYIWLKDNNNNIDFNNHSFTYLYLDTTGPSNFTISNYLNGYYNKTPTIIYRFEVIGVGINTSSVQFAFSTNGSLNPTNWINVNDVFIDSDCTIKATDGDTGILYAKIDAVPFNQFSLTSNTIRLRASDLIGNLETQPLATIIPTINYPPPDNNLIIIIIIIIVVGGSIAAGTTFYYVKLRTPLSSKKTKSSELSSEHQNNLWKKTSTPSFDPNILKEKYDDTPFIFKDSLEIHPDILLALDQIPFSDDQKSSIIDELKRLSYSDQNALIKKIIYENYIPAHNIDLNSLISKFNSLIDSNKLSEALTFVEIILEVAEIQGNQSIFDKFYEIYLKFFKK